jgi:hypothetical protein
MNNTYNLSSILDAIREINEKKKKKITPFVPKVVDKPKEDLLSNTGVLPITENLILEAEEHAKKFKNDSLVLQTKEEDILILNKEYDEQALETIDFESIKKNIIDDLYSSLSKKVKKNTLKTIFDLRQKINDLEKKIESLKFNKVDEDLIQDNNINSSGNKDYFIKEDDLQNREEHLINEDNTEDKEYLTNEDNTEDKEYLTNEDNTEDKEYLTNEDNDNLPDSIIKTLKLQNSLIKKLERNEEKLLLKIVDLEQDLSLLGNKKISIDKNASEDSIRELKNNFDNQIETPDQQNSKTERELIFFKENYEQMIIKNNEVNIKLSNSQERIIIFEKNIKELKEGFENLSNILSKNFVIKLNDPLLKIHTNIDHTKKDKLK